MFITLGHVVIRVDEHISWQLAEISDPDPCMCLLASADDDPANCYNNISVLLAVIIIIIVRS